METKWTLHAGRAIETEFGTFTINRCDDWRPGEITKLDEFARLIAASPALYEACKTLLANQRDPKHCSCNRGTIGIANYKCPNCTARAALAQADGK